LISVFRITGDEYLCFCPFHKDDNASLSINVKKLVSNCFAGCEGAKGNLVSVVSRLEKLPQTVAWRKIVSLDEFDFSTLEVATVKKPKRSYPIGPNGVLWKSAVNYPYLKNRGFLPSTIKFWEVDYSPDIRHIRFPIYNSNHELLSHSYRTTESDVEPKYLHPGFFKKSGVLYGEGVVDSEYKEVYLTEGALDAMWLWQNGYYNAFAVLGTPSIEQIKHAMDFGDEFVLCFDADQAGNIDTEKVVKELVKRRLPYRTIKLPDGKDVQDLSRQELFECFKRRN
jgi:DNA primase